MHKKKPKGLKAPKGTTVITMDWINTDVLLFFTNKQRKSIARQLDLEDDEMFMASTKTIGGMAYSVMHNGVYYNMIFMPEPDLVSLVHECTHMVHMLCDSRGIPLSMDNTETIAYMTGHLFQEACAAIQERQEK